MGELSSRGIIQKMGPIVEGEMNAVRILAPFGLSAILFILAYLSSRDSGSGFFPIILLGIGIILAVVGVAAIFTGKKGE